MGIAGTPPKKYARGSKSTTCKAAAVHAISIPPTVFAFSYGENFSNTTPILAVLETSGRAGLCAKMHNLDNMDFPSVLDNPSTTNTCRI